MRKWDTLCILTVKNIKHINTKICWTNGLDCGTCFAGQRKLIERVIDDSSYRLNFDLGKKNKIHHHS